MASELKPFAHCCAEAGGDPANCDCVNKDHGTAVFHSVCSMPNCRNRAPADEAFCAKHRSDQVAERLTRPAPEYAGLVERLGDAELQRLLKDLTPYREKTIGSLRIDMGEVRKICRAVEVCDEAATALTALTERNKALEAEVERLREAFDEAEDDLCEYFFRSDSAERVRCTICKAEDFTRSSMDHRPGCSVGRLRAALGDRP